VEQEILIPAVYVHTIMIPAAGHEAGHGVVAHHYGARVLGIAVGFIPERRHQGMLLHAIHEDKSDWSTETRCVVKAAGPAADLLIRGAIDEQGASGDSRDIQVLTGNASLEPYLSTAKEVLTERREQLACITAALRQKLLKPEERYLLPLTDRTIGAFLLDEAEMMQCLNPTSSASP
jgi:hypothetical protein